LDLGGSAGAFDGGELVSEEGGDAALLRERREW